MNLTAGDSLSVHEVAQHSPIHDSFIELDDGGNSEGGHEDLLSDCLSVLFCVQQIVGLSGPGADFDIDLLESPLE